MSTSTASLERRVEALETSTGGGRECPECGWDGVTPLKHEVSWGNDGTPAENRYCGTCGRPTHIVITWGDAPD